MAHGVREFHWAAYGQMHGGHALLAASGAREIASRLTQFTDRPGDPPHGLLWEPVTSGFSFAEYFIILRTMRDPAAGRAGMVRSYAAFIPVSDLAGIERLEPIAAMLPHDVRNVGPSVASLKVPETDLESVAAATVALDAVVSRLSGNEPTPIVWHFEADYFPTMDAVWSRLPLNLRSQFAFAFQFAPEHAWPLIPKVVATLPKLATRWHPLALIDLSQSAATALNDPDPSTSYMTVLRDYGMEVQAFADLQIVGLFAELMRRRPALQISELTKAIRILSHYGAPSGSSQRATRRNLYGELLDLFDRATAEEVLALRNLDPAALADFVEKAQNSLRQWVATSAAQGRYQDCRQVCDEALESPEGWWSVPLLKWLQDLCGIEGQPDVPLLVACVLPSSRLQSFVLAHTPSAPRVAAIFFRDLPTAASTIAWNCLLELAASRSWWKVHALILCRIGEDRPKVLVAHVAAAGAASMGYEIFVSEWGYARVLVAALTLDTAMIRRWLGTILPLHYSEVAPEEICSVETTADVLESAVAVERFPWSGGFRRWMIGALNLSANHLLMARCVEQDPILLFECSDARSVLALIGDHSALKGAITEHVALELTAGCPLPSLGASELELPLDPSLLLRILCKSSGQSMGSAGLAAFQALPALGDEQCSSWLQALFTATTGSPIPPTIATKIGTLLQSRNFPRSAQIVRDTVYQFYRGDVAPALQVIESSEGAAIPHTLPPRGKLPRVLIATALPLEREAVMAHLKFSTYEDGVDQSFWPPTNPHFEIIVLVTEAGNLSALQAAGETIRRVKPLLAFFVGVGGGIKDFRIGDVGYSKKVYFVEGGKETSRKRSARPDLEKTDEDLVQLAHRVAGSYSRSNGDDSFDVHAANIVSGEKVLGSASRSATQFQHVRSSYSDGQIVDMEGYGFMKAVRSRKVKLSMVIRGVSDLCSGKATESDESDQPLAAAHAAEFLFALLRHSPALFSKRKRKKTFGFDVADKIARNPAE